MPSIRARTNGGRHITKGSALGALMARIGLALYWTAIVVACAAGGIAVFGALFGESDDRFLIDGLLVMFGATVWLIGFGCWKALSSDQPLPRDMD